MVGTLKEQQTVAAQLRELLSEVEWLRERIISGRRLTSADQQEMTERLTLLKERLQNEHKRMDTLRGQAELNDAEKAFYSRTIHKAFVALSIRRGSKPGPKWRDRLYATRLELRYTLDQLDGNNEKKSTQTISSGKPSKRN